MGIVARLKRERLYVKALGLSYLLTQRAVSPGLTRAKSRYGEIFFRPADSDLKTFWDTLGAREYDLAKFPQYATVRRIYDAALAQGQMPVIIDAGANIGTACIWFSHQFPAARILAVEPDPANLEVLRLNTRGRNVEIVEAAIGARAGSVSLVPGDASWGVQTVRGGDVPITTVAELLGRVENGRLLLVKIDIEGFEDDLFSEATDWIAQAPAIFIEPHDWMLPGRRSSRSFRAAIGPEFDMLISGENLIFVRDDGAETASI